MIEFGNNIVRQSHFVLVALLMLLFTELHAQQEWGYTQYLFNMYDVNSAYAGNHNVGSFSVRYRSQWIRMPGAPETQYISYNSPIFHHKVGLGVKLLNESIGARNQMIAKASAAYKLHFQNATLSVGFGGGVVRQGMDLNALKAYDRQDVQLQNLGERMWTPLVDVSAFYNTDRFFAGVESGRLNRSNIWKNDNSIARLYYRIDLVSGYILPIKRDARLLLSGMLRVSEYELWQAELNILFMVKNRFWFGGGYRWNSNAQVMACYNVTEQLRMGVSYDISTTAIKGYNDGSAEVFLGFVFKEKEGKSIRYF